jgi:hypothetical protein
MGHMKSTDKHSESHQKEPCNTGSSTDNTMCGRCHMATGTASHIHCECVASSEFRFCYLGKYTMEFRDFDEIQLCKTLLFQRYGTNGGINQMGTYNRSENGRGAWVALCIHTTYHTQYLVKSINYEAPHCVLLYSLGPLHP